jgi:D-alanyl-D-alanine-carboxypeptidase/D-alanyl-D-alanine-endopeptidase
MAAVDAVLVQQVADRAVRSRAGVIVGHLAVDGTTTVRGAGHVALPAGPTPRADTLFEVGSVTKVFTGLLLALAVVECELAVDIPVGDLVPEVAGLGRDGVLVTLGHLATHTSGLPRTHGSLLRGSVDMLLSRDPWASTTERSLLNDIRSGPVQRTPGTGRPKYSNSGFGLLGIALARHAGLPFGDLVTERITQPLGLRDTVVPRQRTDEQRRRTATGHHFRRTPAPPWPVDGLPAAGALLSTATDLMVFAHAHLVPPGGALGEAIQFTLTEHARGIGLAWQLTNGRDGSRLAWHNGGTGGFRSMLALRPDDGHAVAVLTNHARSVDFPALRLLGRL